MVKTPDEVYRDYVIDGVPSSGEHDPIKADIRDLLNNISEIIRDDTKAMLFHFDGQSNMALSNSHTWTPAPNVFRWNNTVQDEDSVGTAFAALSGSSINLPDAILSAVAYKFPHITFYSVVSAYGSQSIDHWRIGLPFLWETDTTSSAPAAGTVKINNATPASATTLYASETDANGFARAAMLALIDTDPCEWIRIEDASDPSIYVEYTPGTFTDNGTDITLTLTYVSSAGTLGDGDPVRFRIGPDVFTMAENNVPAAVTAAGVAGVNFYVRMQGESDVSAQFNYPNDFNEVMDLYRTEEIHDKNTQVVICGIVSTEINAQPVYDLLNYRLQKCVHGDPDRRIFVNTAAIPSSFWTDTFSVHLTALGQAAAGQLIADNIVHGARRSVPPGLSMEIGNDFLHIEVTEVVQENRGGTLNWTLSGDGASTFRVRRYSDDVTGASVRVGKARGEIGIGAADVVNSDTLGQFDFEGRAGSVFATAARVTAQVVEASPSASALGGRLQFLANTPGTVTLATLLQMDTSTGFQAFGSNVFLDPNRNFQCRSYTVATLPAATTAAKILYVSNEAGGATIAFSDGTNWKRVSDLATVS